MTVGIARKFGRRVLIVTDTMITDRSSGRPDVIPGALKAVILDPRVSVAYAGHIDPAIHAIRHARDRLLTTGDVSKAREVLIQAAASDEWDVEFIFVHHLDGEPQLQKISKLGITLPLDNCHIGDSAIVSRLLEINPRVAGTFMPHLEIEAEENSFWNAFSDAFHASGTTLAEGVGGVLIGLVASPYGHFYTSYASVRSWQTIDLLRGWTPAQHAAERSGQGGWAVNVMGARLRGTAAVAIALQQPGLGFIHSPLTLDKPLKIIVHTPDGPEGFINAAPLLEALVEKLGEVEAEIGGGVVELHGISGNEPV